MKKIILLSFIALSICAFNLKRQQEIADQINALHSTWTAEAYGIDYSPLLGTFLDKTMLPPPRDIKVNNNLLESFDLRVAYSNCESIKEIRDQANCGSCWAFGAAEVMSDRICIHSNQKLQTRVSPQHLVTCCTSCGFGCSGGYPSSAFRFWVNKGIPSGGNYGDTTTCKPYFLDKCDHHIQGSLNPCGDTEKTPSCTNECVEGYNKTLQEDLTYGASFYSVRDDEQEIMTEIYEKGSVEAAFEVYEDFTLYKSGIYKHEIGSYLGGHAIKIIGWGVENGKKYWLCVNSWNENWGEEGLFRIVKGEDECAIESEIVAGMPKL